MDRPNGPEAAMDPDSAKRSRFATPPDCPKCDLMKNQMNRTIQNYQKAYRKKVEGLKVELSAARTDNQRLKIEVRKMRKKRMVHLPSAALGLVAGWLTHKFVVQLWEKLRAPAPSQQQQQKAVAVPAPAAVVEAAPAASEPATEPAPAAPASNAAPAAEAETK